MLAYISSERRLCMVCEATSIQRQEDKADKLACTFRLNETLYSFTKKNLYMVE